MNLHSVTAPLALIPSVLKHAGRNKQSLRLSKKGFLCAGTLLLLLFEHTTCPDPFKAPSTNKQCRQRLRTREPL